MTKLIILIAIAVGVILLFFIVWGLIDSISDSIKEYSTKNSDDEKPGFVNKDVKTDFSKKKKVDAAE